MDVGSGVRITSTSSVGGTDVGQSGPREGWSLKHSLRQHSMEQSGRRTWSECEPLSEKIVEGDSLYTTCDGGLQYGIDDLLCSSQWAGREHPWSVRRWNGNGAHESADGEVESLPC